jgi:hypothetical protein
MKPYLILNTAARLVMMAALSVCLAGIAHAQNNAAGTTTGGIKQPCAGPNGLTCPGGMNCVDDPSDKCDPTRDGDKCMGICTTGVKMQFKQPCAGPSGLTCPGGMNCVDDPSDKCDPTRDGEKCMGICEARTK